MRETFFVVHHNDLDGIMAALIVKMYLCKMYGSDVHIDFVMHNYEDTIVLPRKKYTWGYIVDISFTEATLPTLVALAQKSINEVIWLDHHIVSRDVMNRAEIRDIGVVPVIDNDRSGAMLAWDQCFPGTPKPKSVVYTDDYDRWVHSDPNSAIFNAGASFKAMTINNTFFFGKCFHSC